MCTVTYVPISQENGEHGDFIFTSNRDEYFKRSANFPKRVERGGKLLLYPEDPQANGTWIAVSNKNQLVCILNGAFVKHKHRPPYRLSRGIMALSFFDYEKAEDFFKSFDVQGIEPFTMVVFDDGKLFDFRWDEKQKHLGQLDVNHKHIWSSCPLYPPEWQQKRRNWFADWQEKTKTINRETILDFHKNGGEGNPEYDNVMSRYDDMVRTTSITSVIRTKERMDMRYENLISGEIDIEKIDFL